MKVTATHWVNHNGVWYQAGETYDDGTPEIAETATETQEEPKVTETPAPEQPKRQARKRTTKEK